MSDRDAVLRPDCEYCGGPARYVHWEMLEACCVDCIMAAAWPDGPNGKPPADARPSEF
jgi:hypothetical protein